jgi:hypothetical protein
LPLDVRFTVEDALHFLENHEEFAQNNRSKVPLLTPYLGTVSIQLRQGATGVEAMPYAGSDIGHIERYQEYKGTLEEIYSRVEQRLGSKYLAVTSLGVPNWRNQASISPEEDYAIQVQQLNQTITDLHEILTDPNAPRVPKNFEYHQYCKTYSSAYEIAGKKLVLSSNALNESVVTDIGAALANLESDYPIFRRDFDNKLRNGLYHENYILQVSGSDVFIHYANINNSGGIWNIQNFPPIPLSDVQIKTIGGFQKLW